jgi:hypothetical protein
MESNYRVPVWKSGHFSIRFINWLRRQRISLPLGIAALISFYMPTWMAHHGHRVPVGVYVTVMGLVTAAMAFHEGPTQAEKAGWMLFITALMVAEIRNLYVADLEQSQIFGDISKNFKATQKGLDATADKIQAVNQQQHDTLDEVKQTLQASQAAARNTQPFADIEFEQMQPVGLLNLLPNGHLRFSIFYKNVGNDMPTGPVMDFRDYVGPIDDLPFQKSVAADFDEWWKTSKHREINSVAPNGGRAFGSFDTHTFTEEEIKGLGDNTKTLYCVIRWTYSDKTGKWIGDRCFAFQDIRHDLVVGHDCLTHNNHRYQAH